MPDGFGPDILQEQKILDRPQKYQEKYLIKIITKKFVD